MKSFFLFLFCVISSLCFSQQTEEFRNVKNYYNHHRLLLNNEFKKKYETETNILSKDAIKNDFLFFMKKMDSIENTALIGALLKVKNLEDLGKLHNKNIIQGNQPDLISVTEKSADYPGGINALRQEVANLFYTEGVYAEEKTVKANVAFIVEKDGTVSNVQAQGTNFTFNRQAEIAIYSVSEKFSPAIFKGNTVRYRFKLPLTMTFD
ncbi:hypothetical protein MKJ01_15890 [Chryseobacterium sp. SSA4.19]|uniref:hypothetical protein n=1 Tax=Chryseobacterium sp. SSA4.19 TaxID=2919915 RepID=UPI001F4EFAC5|nr:hypothetical protein [Chryseobacterium sp. SSA4.19]MCJ8155248.1 hypothetical protein [Chryseobacterium sp. SSA4.19]